MKIAVVGAGAMGSLFGGLLAEAGREVWLFDIWQEHVDAINRQGLHIEHDGKSRSINVRATSDAAEIGQVDLAVIFVKSTITAAAAKTAARLLTPQGMVITLQNGMGNAEAIAEHIDAAKILVGTTSHGATFLGPGTIRHAGVGATILGAWKASDNTRTSAKHVAEFFSHSAIETEAVDDVLHIVWDKLLVNVGINAITALTGIKNGELLDVAATKSLSRSAVAEAIAVARAQGIETRADAVEHVLQVAAATGPNRSSMGQDVDHHRQTEIGAINGFIVREAQRLGLQAPVNATLTALIETLQYHYK